MTKPRMINHHPDPGHESFPTITRSRALKSLKISFFVGLGLFLGELIGAVFSGSLALLADSFHVLGDLFAGGLTLLAARLAETPQSRRRSYGYYRLEILAALFNGITLFILAIFVLKSAFERFSNPPEIDGPLMLLVSCIGLFINVLMLLIIRPVHQHNLNVHGAYLHILGDTLSSIGVMAGAGLILLTGLMWIDSFVGVLVAFLLLFMSFRLLWDSIHILLEGTPKHMDPEELEKRLRENFSEILQIHDFHIWEITSHLFAMTAHIEAKINTLEEAHHLIDRLNTVVRKEYGIGHTTFQIEPERSGSP